MHKKKSPQIFTLIPQIFTLIHKVFYKAGMDKIKKESSFHLTPFIQLCRGNKIRTCDHTPPRRVLYRAELYPELLNCECKGTYLREFCKFSSSFFCFNSNISCVFIFNILINSVLLCVVTVKSFVSVYIELSLMF